MNNPPRQFNIFSILSLVCLGLLGNALYFIVFAGHYPECGPWTLVFFNMALLCLFLPMATPAVHRSRHLSSGAPAVIASTYFIIEAVIAACVLSDRSSVFTAVAWQLGALLLFLVFLLFFLSTNRRAQAESKRFDEQRAFTLVEAQAVVSNAFSQETESNRRAILRSAVQALSACTMQSFLNVQNTEAQILDAANALAAEPVNANFRKLNQLISLRNNMISTLNRFS